VKGSDSMEEAVIIHTLSIFGYPFHITLSLIIQWVVIIITLLLSILYSNKVKRIPGKVQSVVEILIEFLTKTVDENMGEGKRSFVPYIGSLGLYLFILNMVGLVGIRPPTSDFSVTLGLALTTFLVIQGYTIKKLGILGYFKGYASPVPILLPINIVERVMVPVSLSLRLFGNVFAATIIMELLYEALEGIHFIAMLGIPVPFHFYFDIFDGTIQMVIFVMLTMINIKIISEH
jgi:F-type H+-transporting ATPase subunit a